MDYELPALGAPSSLRYDRVQTRATQTRIANMPLISLPRTALKVYPICFGTSDIGGAIDQATSFRLLDAYVEGGGNFIDTANVYSDWIPGTKSSSEKTIGAWLQQRHIRGQIILATKGAHPRLESMQLSRMAPSDIAYDLEQSLGHLQTDYIDLYWLHRDDPARPVAEIVETLEGLVAAGKIRYYGCSNWRTDRIQAAQGYAAQQGLQGFVANQMRWSLAMVDPAAVADKTTVVMDEAMYQYHRSTGLAAIPYSAQAQGYFQKLAAGQQGRIGTQQQAIYRPPANQARLQRVIALARELDISLTAVALGYLRAQPFVTVPVIGCRTLEQLSDSLATSNVALTPEQAQALVQGEHF
jgi:aryl-alcohol dehydrogenase-like predicted oxidoreductase